jgi:hypothetical protein
MRTTQGQDAFGHTVQNNHILVKYGESFLNHVPLDAPFQCALNASTLELKHSQCFVDYFDFHITPAKLSRSAKQHPSNSAHLMRRFVRGLSVHVYQFFIPTDFRA